MLEVKRKRCSRKGRLLLVCTIECTRSQLYVDDIYMNWFINPDLRCGFFWVVSFCLREREWKGGRSAGHLESHTINPVNSYEWFSLYIRVNILLPTYHTEYFWFVTVQLHNSVVNSYYNIKVLLVIGSRREKYYAKATEWNGMERKVFARRCCEKYTHKKKEKRRERKSALMI